MHSSHMHAVGTLAGVESRCYKFIFHCFNLNPKILRLKSRMSNFYQTSSACDPNWYFSGRFCFCWPSVLLPN